MTLLCSGSADVLTHGLQVIKGTYTQTDALQGFNANAPAASQNFSRIQSAVASAQVPSNSIIEALSSAAMPGVNTQVRINTGIRGQERCCLDRQRAG